MQYGESGSASAAPATQRKKEDGLRGAFNRFVARPLGGSPAAPARWVLVRDVPDKAFLARHGTLFQYNQGALLVHDITG